ncbi:hypothetical protein CEXT_162651 [Caerostris extrusa]|uniref:Uncharacterized protein n=1 Tax=Caerostris extrusa TaxID=172846 RepID=A0AAV4QQ29_CAEEX|nr:hypothetical protein CEXT_162651 [Caerostris extrusa]
MFSTVPKAYAQDQSEFEGFKQAHIERVGLCCNPVEDTNIKVYFAILVTTESKFMHYYFIKRGERKKRGLKSELAGERGKKSASNLVEGRPRNSTGRRGGIHSWVDVPARSTCTRPEGLLFGLDPSHTTTRRNGFFFFFSLSFLSGSTARRIHGLKYLENNGSRSIAKRSFSCCHQCASVQL